MVRARPIDRICLRHGIEHGLTKPNHSAIYGPNNHAERMNRIIKDATVSRYQL